MIEMAPKPQVTQLVDAQDRLSENVTVIMPFYDRLRYFEHYLSEGFWEGLNLRIVCDGSTSDIINEVQSLIGGRENIDIYSYLQNKGVAHARSTGIRVTKTPFLAFCDDDDFMSVGS